MLSNKLKKHIRRVLFNTFGRFHIRTAKHDDVIILTSSRSGSTWLAESLISTNQFKLYNQPFDTVLNSNIYSNILPSYKNNPFFINLSIEDKLKLETFWFKLISGKINPNVEWRFFSKQFKFFYKRKLIKMFFVKDYIDFFHNQPNLKIIYLTRNPLNRGVSNINYGYHDYGEHLFDSKLLKNNSAIKLEELKEIYNTSDYITTKQVIAWYLENCVISEFTQQNRENILHIKYEDMLNQRELTESTISDFIFSNIINFQLSWRDSKTTIKTKPSKNVPVNKKEIQKILELIPDFLTYSKIEDFE